MAVQSEPQQFLDFLLSSAVPAMFISLQSDISALLVPFSVCEVQSIPLAMDWPAIPIMAKLSTKRQKTCFSTPCLSRIYSLSSRATSAFDRLRQLTQINVNALPCRFLSHRRSAGSTDNISQKQKIRQSKRKKLL